LITTDILGPYNVPWAISQMGYGPGFALYTSFGLLGFYSGLQLWRMFVGLDSTRYPLRNYGEHFSFSISLDLHETDVRYVGDLAFRVFGNWARQIVNVLQSFQFFLNVALIIESNGQGLAQMALGKSGNGYICCKSSTLCTAMIITTADSTKSSLPKSSSPFAASSSGRLGHCSGSVGFPTWPSGLTSSSSS
jgi:hypothetical protein